MNEFRDVESRQAEPTEPKPAASEPTESKPTQPTNWFEDALFFLFAGLAFIFWEPTKWLLRGTYTHKVGQDDYRDADVSSLNVVIGILVSLASGIGVGYNLGFVGHAPMLEWLLYGFGTAGAVFVFGWTTVYMFGFKHAFRLSERLWSHVNIDAVSSYRYSDSDSRRNPAWFSKFLMGVSTLLVGLGTLDVVYEVACHVQANQAGWGWLGWITGVVSCILLVALAISIVAGAARLSGFFGFLVFVIGAVLSWHYWAGVSALFTGLYHNLTGGAWGAWGYVPGALVGVIAGAIVGSAVGSLLWKARLRLIAAVSGIGATYYFAGTTASLVAGIPLGAFAFAAPALPWVAYALQLLLFIGFAFPLVHIVVSHGLSQLANVLDWMEEVYGEARGGYREFFLQVATIAATVGVAVYAPALITATFGLTSVYAVYGLTALLSVICYTAGGSILNATGQWPVGVVTSGYVAVVTFGEAHSRAYGDWVSLAIAAVSAVLTFAVFYPAAYKLVRWATQGWLAAFLRNPLVLFHARVIKALDNLWEELFEAASKTYGDETKYREVFLHLTNILVAFAVLAGCYLAGGMFGFALWLIIVVALIASLLSYLLVGKLLLRFGSSPIGFLAGAVFGVWLGTFIHGAQPADWHAWRYVLSVVGGLGGAALTFGALFPWIYLVVRAVVNVVSPETWLRPILVGAHDALWLRFSTSWANFTAKYRLFQTRFTAARKRFADSYARFSERWKQRNQGK